MLGGIAREQVCIYMCPWPRIQGAMVDHDTLLVTYAADRGEPRGPHKKGQTWEGRGDCIDCKACVAVCPMGIDIRDGSQLECIQCALCIDACNDIMDKVGRPRELIAYDTIASQEAAAHGAHGAAAAHPAAHAALRRPDRPGRRRSCWSRLLNRTTLEINVLHDRNPPFVMLSDGSIRNGYTIKILNKLHEPRAFALRSRDLPGAQITIVGMEAGATIRVTTDDVRELRAFVTLSKDDARAGRAGACPASWS